MLVVNLFGAPGAGKSTGAAYIYSKLKMFGINAELCTEFAKDKVYEENKEVFRNQIYLFAKQYFKITRCENKVDVIVTDSPLLLPIFYNEEKKFDESFKKLALDVFNSYNSLNYFIERVKPYNPSGRFQNEYESDVVSLELKGMLDSLNIGYTIVGGDGFGYDKIISNIIALKYKELGI